MRISDWSSDVCSSDLLADEAVTLDATHPGDDRQARVQIQGDALVTALEDDALDLHQPDIGIQAPRLYTEDRAALSLQGSRSMWFDTPDRSSRRCTTGDRSTSTRRRCCAVERKTTRLNSSHKCAP